MQHKHDIKMQEAALLYAYGELPQTEEKAFLEHLKDCKLCQTTVHASSLFNAALPQVKAPENLTIIDLKQIKVKKPLFSFSDFSFNFRILAPVGAAAIMLIMALGAYEAADIYAKRHSDIKKAGAMQNIDNIYTDIYQLENEVDELIDYIDSL